MKSIASPSKPAREEIDNHIMKLLIGLMAISLATLTSVFAKDPLGSISESYWVGGWSRTIFLGFLFAIAAFLFAYNGKSIAEMIVSKIASLAAICVAMFPCNCDCEKFGGTIPCELVEKVHFLAAAIMFVILAYFCYTFYSRALKPKEGQTHVFGEARLRAFIYAVCGLTILMVIVSVLADWAFSGVIVAGFRTFIFWAEAAGLVAFGIAWLTASRTLPLITNEKERFSLSPFVRQEEGR